MIDLVAGGKLDWDDVVELGDIVTRAHPGRADAGQITVFKSLGLAVEDLAAAEYVVRRAAETGAGTTVEF